MKPCIEIDVDAVLAKTDRAILITVEGQNVWLPKSQLEALNVSALEEVVRMGSRLECVQIPAWLAERLGLKGV